MGLEDLNNSGKIKERSEIRDIKFIGKNLGILYSAPMGIFKRQKEM
ncbi:MAG: hypothetical protein ACE5J5_05305 [Candidatus Hydrothermarchaeales archaeon]